MAKRVRCENCQKKVEERRDLARTIREVLPQEEPTTSDGRTERRTRRAGMQRQVKNLSQAIEQCACRTDRVKRH